RAGRAARWWPESPRPRSRCSWSSTGPVRFSSSAVWSPIRRAFPSSAPRAATRATATSSTWSSIASGALARMARAADGGGLAGYHSRVTDGELISFRVLTVGTPVRAADGSLIGQVARVLWVEDLDVFDGIVIHTAVGLRFVDAPQVEELRERAVLTSISPEDAASLPPPETSGPTFHVDERA